ncbi:MAG TPA: coenzyme F420-0:L-glutamate ligase [Methanospirillum sp.]|nr:coenzyme F420-0:L-glutamate ligase [Methanospirillum sp.]
MIILYTSVTVTGIRGLPLIQKGDDLPGLIVERCALEEGDIICVASTIISKAKGYTRHLKEINPGDRAKKIADMTGEDPRFIQAVLDQACDVLIETPFTLTEVPGGHVGVRSGVDASNVEDGLIITLPPDSMKEAEEIRNELKSLTGKDCGVIVTDTCGRSFRRGQTGHAIGWSGMTAIRDFRGDNDLFGKTLEITEEAVVDEIAGFSNLVMGESNNGVPVVLFRGIPAWSGHDDLYFSPEEDVIRKALKKE